jgi:hypothetical protein
MKSSLREAEAASARWVRVLRALPCLLLIAVACHQIVLSRSSAMAPWSGGGFGMFASTDAGATRHLHAFVRRPGLRREVQVATSEADRVRRMLTLPTESRLHSLALTLADIPTPDHGPATAVEVQVWHTRFDPKTLTPTSQILRSLEVSLVDD